MSMIYPVGKLKDMQGLGIRNVYNVRGSQCAGADCVNVKAVNQVYFLPLRTNVRNCENYKLEE